MRSPSSRVLINSVTVRHRTWGDTRGQRTVSGTTDVAWLTSVQPATAERVPDHMRADANITHIVLFNADPAAKADDHILWSGRTLLVAGPASDQAGRGAAWEVFCTEQQ